MAQSIVHEEKKITVNVEDMIVDNSYTGPSFKDTDEITPEWVQSLMDWQKDQKKLDKKYVTMIILKATELFEQADTLVDVSVDDLEEITVCGDVHG